MTGQHKPVAFLLGNLTVGGSETKFVRLANRLAKQGHDVHILVLGPPYTLLQQIDDAVKVRCFDRTSKYSVSILLKIREYFLSFRMHSVVCVNPYPIAYGWPACASLDRVAYRCIASINTSEFVSVRDKFFMPLYGFILRRCDRVVFGCQNQAAAWTHRYRIAKSRATVIYNGVDTDYFRDDSDQFRQVRDDLLLRQTSSIIGCVAQFRPEKRHQNLLEALNRLVNHHHMDVVLILVGDGPEESALRRFVDLNGLNDNVRFAGQVADVRPYLSLLDVFVMPSIAVEVFSNAMLEAIAMGVPIVSSDVGGSAEMIEHEREGFIYPRHDVDQLTEYLKTLITDSGLAGQFRNRAMERLRAAYTIEKMDHQYADAMWS